MLPPPEGGEEIFNYQQLSIYTKFMTEPKRKGCAMHEGSSF